MSTVLRGDEEQVRPLELFFDLVFVLAITQCTALMSHEPTWEGLAVLTSARASPSCAAGCATPPRRRAEGQAARRPRACIPRSSNARGAAETSASACGPGVP